MSKKMLLKKTNSGYRPFATIKDADDFLDSQEDFNGEVIEIDGGYGIMKTEIPAKLKLRYWLCYIPPRSNPEDLDVVHLSLNGYLLSVRRGQDVILPDTLIEVANNAVRKTYEIKDSTTVYTGSISVCPVMKKEEKTEADFRAQCNKGNAQRDQEIKDKLARS